MMLDNKTMNEVTKSIRTTASSIEETEKTFQEFNGLYEKSRVMDITIDEFYRLIELQERYICLVDQSRKNVRDTGTIIKKYGLTKDDIRTILTGG